MRRGEIDTKLNKNIAEFPSILLGTSPAVGIVLWAIGLGVLAASLYLAPTITALALAAFGLGLPLFLLAWFRPEFGLLALIFLTSSFVPADIVDVRLPIGGGLDLRDLTLLGMLGLLGFQGLTRKALPVPWWPIGMLLLAFLGLAVFSAVYALFFQGVEPNWALNDLRILMYYAVFFVTSWVITQRRQLAIVLAGLFLIADLTAGIVILQQFLGTGNRLLAAMSGTHWHLWQQDAASGGFGLVRVVPPGHVLMYFMMVIAFGLMVFTRQNPRLRAILALQFVYLNVGLLLTYTRAQWVAAAIALGLIFIVLLPTYKAQFARYLVVGIPVLLLAYTLFGTELQESIENVPVANALAERALSIFTPGKTLETFSLQWRLFETEEALRSISEHPLLGVALGNSYRDVTLLRGEASGRFQGGLARGVFSRFTRFIHSSYLSITVKMGLPALIGFLWFCVASIVKGWQLYRNLSESQLKGLVLAVVAGFIGLLQWSLLHQRLMETESTSVVGLMVGLIASVQYIQRRESGVSPFHGQSLSRIGGGELSQ